MVKAVTGLFGIGGDSGLKDLKRSQAKQEARVAKQEEEANRALAASLRASFGSRAGRRSLSAPGRDNAQSTLGTPT